MDPNSQTPSMHHIGSDRVPTPAIEDQLCDLFVRRLLCAMMQLPGVDVVGWVEGEIQVGELLGRGVDRRAIYKAENMVVQGHIPHTGFCNGRPTSNWS